MAALESGDSFSLRKQNAADRARELAAYNRLVPLLRRAAEPDTPPLAVERLCREIAAVQKAARGGGR